ncbi:SMAKA protein, partial [Rhinopomastus cyanomelas]|nr:SMAKA protein [Rhinopomastus cyanomelas]
MGCIKSKAAFPDSKAVQDEKIREGHEGRAGEKSLLIDGKADDKGPSSAILLDYTDRLSRQILDEAMKQLAVLESKYSDIPFIESDVL